MCVCPHFIFVLLFIVFTIYVLAARITQYILSFVKMQSDYFVPVRCAVPILRVLTMILRGIIGVEYFIYSPTYSLIIQVQNEAIYALCIKPVQ